jgi:hypothetical protein
MTELTKYTCDMCGLEQQIDTTIPDKYQTNYVRFIGMISNLDKGLRVQALCPQCAIDVGEFIMKNRRLIISRKDTSNNNKTENRVSTIR